MRGRSSMLCSISPPILVAPIDQNNCRQLGSVKNRLTVLLDAAPAERARERGRADNGIMAASYWREWSERETGREKSAVNRLKTVREHDMNEPQFPSKIYHESLL